MYKVLDAVPLLSCKGQLNLVAGQGLHLNDDLALDFFIVLALVLHDLMLRAFCHTHLDEPFFLPSLLASIKP